MHQNTCNMEVVVQTTVMGQWHGLMHQNTCNMELVVQTTVMGQWAWINASEHLQHGASGTNYSNGTMDMD